MMSKALKFPDGELARLAELHRQEQLKRKLADPPAPLFIGVRELVLRKCKPERKEQVQAILEKQPFGEVGWRSYSPCSICGVAQREAHFELHIPRSVAIIRKEDR